MKKVLLTAFILLLGFIINPQVILAQCQCPNDIEPTGLSWTSETATITIYEDDELMDPSCEMVVNYCWREYDLVCPYPCGTVVEIWVCNFTPTENCDEDFSLPIWQIIEKLAKRIIILDPNQNGWYYPPCNDPRPPNFATYKYDCYDANGLSCGGSVYCKVEYDVRMCGGQRLITESTRYTIGGDCPYLCGSKCNN